MYQEFAYYYDKLGWERFSYQRVEFILDFLKNENQKVSRILDIACGTGTFCFLMAEKGFHLTGIDLSKEMLSMARDKAREKKLKNVRFFLRDMINFNIHQTFDLVTCNFDSINHILVEKEVFSTFQCVFRHLRKNGAFIFDVNTIYGLQNWRYQDINQTDTHLTLVHGVYEKNLKRAILFIDGFVKSEDDKYIRFQETIPEQGYSLKILYSLLRKAGFKKIEPIGQSKGKSRKELESQMRVILCARK